MKIVLLPLAIKNLKEFRAWLDKNVLDTATVIGIREKCLITKLSEFSYQGPRWNTYAGIPIYYNF